MIFHSNAIIQPGTMVIKSFYAMSADGAVSTTTSSNRLAIRTELRRINGIQHFHEVNFIIGDIARLREGCKKIEEDTHSCQDDGQVYLCCRNPYNIDIKGM